MNSGDYKQFIINSMPYLPEILSSILWELDILGITEEDNFLKIYVEDQSNVNKSLISIRLNKLVEQKLIKTFSINEELIPLKNWNEEWEKCREVIRVSDRIVVKPTFKTYTPQNNEIILTIDPKMSFGTGEHQTTKLMLRLLEKYIKKDDNILDVGSGTGILSIAGIKLGARYSVAVDVDEVCLDNCKENCELNNVIDNIKILCGEITDVNERDFDVIIANIQKNILLVIAPLVESKIKKSGIVILSGLLKEDENEVIDRYLSLGFKNADLVYLDEWLALVFKNEKG